jgi:hypothetical protein
MEASITTTGRGTPKTHSFKDNAMKKNKIVTTVVHWTPRMAQALLAVGGPNRKVNENKVEEYAAMMKAGKWEMNGETVKISRAGKLLDGQHRLHAVALSAKTVSILTVKNLAPRTQATIDNGFKRTIAHILEIQGEKNSTALAFALSLLCRWETGQLHTVRARGQSNRPRRDECVGMLKSHPDIRHYISHKFATHFTRLGSSGLFSFCWYVCSKTHPDVADLFFEQLSLGVAMGTEDPVWHLRERLVRSKQTEDPRKKLDTLQKIQLIAYSWNQTVLGKTMKRLHLPQGTDVPEFK